MRQQPEEIMFYDSYIPYDFYLSLTDAEKRLANKTAFYTPRQLTKEGKIRKKQKPITLSTDKKLPDHILRAIGYLATAFDHLFTDESTTRCAKAPAECDAHWATENGCCANCASNNGFFQHAAESSGDQLRELKKKFGFSKTYGYFDNKNKRCNLPRARRSMTCLRFCCTPKLNKISDPMARALAEIRDYYKLIK